MPLYEYVCPMGHLYEELQSIRSFNKERIVLCPECGETMQSVIHGGIAAFVDNVTTIGQLGERNWAKLGKNRQQEMLRDQNSAKNAAAKEAGLDSSLAASYKKMRKLDSLTKEQKVRY